MIIHAIDPGLARTGIVSWNTRIASVNTINTRGGGHRCDPTRTYERCAEITMAVLEIVQPGEHVVIEAYEDIPGNTYRGAKDKNGKPRNAANRWTTPMVIGYLCHALDAQACPVILQHPHVVLTQYAEEIKMWENGTTGLVRGDHLLGHPESRRKSGNGHERAAAAHLAFYLERRRAGGLCV